MDWLNDPQIWMALITLTVLEIVLGIDNIVFISILAGNLPTEQQGQARLVGLAMAMMTRILLLLSLSWIMGLTKPFFSLFGHGVSGRDLILLVGGLFLMYKSTIEIHRKLEDHHEGARVTKAVTYGSVIAQIVILDIVFSLDSVITAIGMANRVAVMIAAIVIAVLFMMVFARSVSAFIEKHPTIKMLALSFLLLIGVVLIADGCGLHIPKGYIYFAMAFSIFVEMLNLRLHARRQATVSAT